MSKIPLQLSLTDFYKWLTTIERNYFIYEIFYSFIDFIR